MTISYPNDPQTRLLVGCGSANPTAGQPATVAVRLLLNPAGITVPGGGAPSYQADGALVGPDHAGVVHIVRLNADASEDVVIGIARGTAGSLMSGSVHLYRMAGSSPFGSGPVATHTLGLLVGSPFPTVIVTGGTPGNPCLLGASLSQASAPIPVAGGQVLIDVFDPSFVLLPSVFPFNPNGNAPFTLSAAYTLPLTGLTWFVQAVALDAAAPQGAFFSSGIGVTL
jgi:hypothetical protein